jgi:hypothetical protein
MLAGHRFRSLLAMNCQVAAVAADGTEVPYSGAPVVREYDAVLPINFWGLHPSSIAFVGVQALACLQFECAS